MTLEPPNLATLPEDDEPTSRSAVSHGLVLAVVWCRDEPWRVGEILVAPTPGSEREFHFGRGVAGENEPSKAHLVQLRPGVSLPSTALGSPSISRYQLELRASTDEQFFVHNTGRAALFHNDEEVTEAVCRPGDLIQIGKQLLFLCVRRPFLRPGKLPYPEFSFGSADPYGIVGESAEVWLLRHHIAFLASRRDPVLVYGESGTGKHLAVQAIHALSRQGVQRLVTARTVTRSLTTADTELFGKSEHERGHSEGPGLVAEAQGSTLCVEDFEHLSAHVRVELLRAAETSNFRLLATCAVRGGELPVSVAARFGFSLCMPELNAHREDIALLARHVLRQEAERGDDLARACFRGGDWRGEPNVPLTVMRQLLQLDYTTHVRQVKAALWRALADAELGYGVDDAGARPSRSPVAPTEAAPEVARATEPPLAADANEPLPAGLSARTVQDALDRNNGVIEATWRALGLKNRFVLLRLIRRYNLEIRKRPASPGARLPKR